MTHYEIILKEAGRTRGQRKKINVYIDSGQCPYSNDIDVDYLDYLDISLLIPAEKIYCIYIVIPKVYLESLGFVGDRAYFGNREWYRLGL
jgi:hypothetical protein